LRRRAGALWGLGALTVAAWLGAPAADAQIRWDVGAEAGAMQRVMSGAGSAATLPDPGPTVELRSDVALFPLVRVGPYAEYDLVSGPIVRHTVEGGLRVKVTPPLFSRPWRTWISVGAGFADSIAEDHDVPGAGGQPVRVPGAAGLIVDVPVGLGIGARVSEGWMVYAELAARFGVAFAGALYERCSCEPSSYAGRDALAASLGVGVSLDE
jgi:hypothetical protein